MKTSSKRRALLAALVLTSGGWASANTNEVQNTQPQTSIRRQQVATTPDATTATQRSTYEQSATGQSTQPLKINKGSSLIGATVKNQQGEILGKIRDLVVDLNSEKISYAVLDTSTGLFSSQKLHAVPLRAFQTDAEGTGLILNADKEKIAQSEGFDKNNWPAMNSPAWGAEPFWKQSQTKPLDGVDNSKLNRETTKEPAKAKP